MSVRNLFENHPPKEIEELFDTWGQRDFKDIPSDTFFATLKEIEKLHSPQHIDMESEIVGDKLVFIPPQDTPLPFAVHDNEIILGDYTIRVHLKSADNVAPARA